MPSPPPFVFWLASAGYLSAEESVIFVSAINHADDTRISPENAIRGDCFLRVPSRKYSRVID